MESDKRNYGILNDLKLNSVIKKKIYFDQTSLRLAARTKTFYDKI